MKILVVTAFVFILVISVQAELGFSLNGTFNPGFTIGGPKRREAPVKDDEGNEDNETQWPNPDSINNFPVPDSFANVNGETTGNDAEPTIQSSHGRHRPHRSHRH